MNEYSGRYRSNSFPSYNSGSLILEALEKIETRFHVVNTEKRLLE